jgi:acetyl-CoA carboxylase alpha subunit
VSTLTTRTALQAAPPTPGGGGGGGALPRLHCSEMWFMYQLWLCQLSPDSCSNLHPHPPSRAFHSMQ